MNACIHTLSPNQANELIENIDKLIIKCKKSIERHTNELLYYLRDVWADANAVEFVDMLVERIKHTIQQMIYSANSINEYIVFLSTRYAAVGGIRNTVVNNKIETTISINKEYVKASFNEAGTYGFIDNSKTKEVYDLISTYGQSITEITSQLQDDIKHTNAFGNPNIVTQLNILAEKIVEAMQAALNDISKYAEKVIMIAEKGYEKVSDEFSIIIQ